MRKPIYAVALTLALAAGCNRGGEQVSSTEKSYEVVAEGSASGVTSTIGGPGETVALTNTNADTTTNLTLLQNGVPPTATTDTSGNLAEVLPDGTLRGGVPPSTTPTYTPRPASSTPTYNPPPAPPRNTVPSTVDIRPSRPTPAPSEPTNSGRAVGTTTSQPAETQPKAAAPTESEDSEQPADDSTEEPSDADVPPTSTAPGR